MTLTLQEKQQKLSECETSNDFYNLYTIIFKEEVPHTGLKSGDDEFDLVIEAIIENKKIEAVKIDDRFTGVRE